MFCEIKIQLFLDIEISLPRKMSSQSHLWYQESSQLSAQKVIFAHKVPVAQMISTRTFRNALQEHIWTKPESLELKIAKNAQREAFVGLEWELQQVWVQKCLYFSNFIKDKK